MSSAASHPISRCSNARQAIAKQSAERDKSGRRDGTFERADFAYDAERDVYICPGGKELKQSRRTFTKPREKTPDEHGMLRYPASKADCDACERKARCCPKAPSRKVLRSIFEPSRDRARAIAQTTDYAISCKLRKKEEMLFAQLKRIPGLGRLRLRGPSGARDEFHLAATAQNLRKLAKLLPIPQVAC
ncbi:transposase [Salipiger thiooxidans]|nr:transposase [Salipiger thiooxidans]